jgi:predicted molibdopterin-dependent oxidoreductase YjgC
MTQSTMHVSASHGERVTIFVDNQPVEARLGETVASALLAQGLRILRRTDRHDAPRGLFCGMGVCYDCLVTIDGIGHCRACLSPVCANMRVETGTVTS